MTKQDALYKYVTTGFPLNENKHRRMGKLDKADFILFDGEGMTAEVYFYKIVKQNHKPKALKIVGALKYVPDNNYERPEVQEKFKQGEREKCNKITEYPMRFIEESDWEKLKKYYNLQLKIPIIYKGDTALHFDDERIPFRYHRENERNYEFDISVLVILGALEILTRDGLIAESSIMGKSFTFPTDYSNISFSEVFSSKNMEMKNELGERIHNLIWLNGFTIRILAEKVGVTYVTMTRYINGERIPNSKTLAKIATALHVDANTLLGVDIDNNDPEKDFYEVQRLTARNAENWTKKQKADLILAIMGVNND